MGQDHEVSSSSKNQLAYWVYFATSENLCLSLSPAVNSDQSG